jgi:hypothetical protein
LFFIAKTRRRKEKIIIKVLATLRLGERIIIIRYEEVKNKHCHAVSIFAGA